MSEENKSLSPSHQLRADVVSGLATSGSTVRGLVVDRLVQAEIDRRAEAVGKLLDYVASKEKELRQAESQGTVTFTLGGNAAGDPVYTKQQIEGMNKLKQEVGNIQSALQAAFDHSDFKKVLEIASKVGKGSTPSE